MSASDHVDNVAQNNFNVIIWVNKLCTYVISYNYVRIV